MSINATVNIGTIFIAVAQTVGSGDHPVAASDDITIAGQEGERNARLRFPREALQVQIYEIPMSYSATVTAPQEDCAEGACHS